MTKKYKQFDLAQRYKIEAYLSSGYSQSEIAIFLGVHKSTISRELTRNVPKRGKGAKIYGGTKADNKTISRHKFKPKYTSFSYPLKKQMREWMSQKKYSPELVHAQWKKDGIKGVSHETMYKFIWRSKHSNKRSDAEFKNIHIHLKHGKRRRKRGNYKHTRGLIPNRVSIVY